MSKFWSLGGKIAWYGFGSFMLVVYTTMAIANGSFFHRETEKDRLDLAIARDRIWNLSKSYEGLVHRFFVLRNGLRLHYVTNRPTSRGPLRPLVILLHGYPDSYSVWRFLFQSKVLMQEATVVAVDLPGFGGSDSFPPYSASVVLDALTEFIIDLREKYSIDEDADSGCGSVDSSSPPSKVYIVGHDWGCVLGCRLAAEAPVLADRFILSNGPLPQLALSNYRRRAGFVTKVSRSLFRSPYKFRHSIPKIIRNIIPLARQAFKMGYIPAFHLPADAVRYLLAGRGRAFFRGIHQLATGQHNSMLDEASYIAGILGPSTEECKTQTDLGAGTKSQTYPGSVVQRVAQNNGAYEATEYYRSGTALDRWEKSLETIAALYDIESASVGFSPRRHSSGALLFGERHEGALRTAATIIWGSMDPILTREICLDGIKDYLAKGSDVVVLPRTGHWTPSEVEGRQAFTRIVEWAVRGESREDLEKSVREVYEGARVTVRV